MVTEMEGEVASMKAVKMAAVSAVVVAAAAAVGPAA